MVTERADRCVYVHRRPDTGDIFYVGLGSKSRARNFAARNRKWKRIVDKAGKPIVEIVADLVTTEEAARIERSLIKEIGLHNLANMSPGGDGVFGATHTEESRRKVGDASRGRRHTEDAKRRIGDASRGERNPNYRKTPSDDVRRRISESLKGKTLAEETKRKISEALKGITRSPETRRKMSEGQRVSKDSVRGVPLKEGHRIKISEALSGKPKSEEHKRKLSEGRLGENNPYADKNSYKFTHAIHGTIYCSRHELRAKYDLQSHGISKLVLGKLQSYHGWRLLAAANDNAPSEAKEAS